jgi:hypothetical protein
MVTILDDHGLIVSTGSARIDADARVIAFTPANAGAMLGYYFDRAGRHVVVDFGEVRLLGRIETRWDGQQRHWLVRTDPPTVLTEAPAAGARKGSSTSSTAIGAVPPLPLAS